MLDIYRKRLLAIWCVGFFVPFLLVLLQYFGGKYGDKFGEAVGWLTALTLSTILLMIGVMISNPVAERDAAFAANIPANQMTDTQKEALAAAFKKEQHERFVFRLAAAASITYLLIINLAFFAEPLVSAKPQELMRDSKIWLAFLDSFVSLLIGYFFGKK
jgi:hypothetical protein